MENAQPRGSYQFIVRLWAEDLGGGEREWRGKAQNIATGEFVYFRGLTGLADAIQRMLELRHTEPEPRRADV